MLAFRKSLFISSDKTFTYGINQQQPRSSDPTEIATEQAPTFRVSACAAPNEAGESGEEAANDEARADGSRDSLEYRGQRTCACDWKWHGATLADTGTRVVRKGADTRAEASEKA